MKRTWLTELRGHLLIWFVLQLFVSTFISLDMLNNYASWEEDIALNSQLENEAVYNIALLSAMFTVTSTAFLNLTIVVIVLGMVYKLQKRWMNSAITQYIYVKGAQFILYGLMLSEILKYFCVLLWTFRFSEWEHLRQVINLSCVCLGSLFGGLIWLKMRNQANQVGIKAIMMATISIVCCLGSISFL